MQSEKVFECQSEVWSEILPGYSKVSNFNNFTLC